MKIPLLTGRACCPWSCWLLAALALQFAARADQIIYDDALENGWNNWGWATLNYANTSPVHSGSDSVSVTIVNSSQQAIYIEHAAFDSSPYTNLVFWINGGSAGGQQLLVQGHANGAAMSSTNLPPLMTNTWQQFSIPLAILGVANTPNMDGFWIQDRIGAIQPTFYVDDISLQAGAPIVSGTISISVDAQANRRAISPLIYGVAFATNATLLRDLNVPLHRSGGNGTTTYNWQNNAWNHAADWYFESIPESSSAAGADGDDFITTSKNGGAQAMLTIPIIGWVAKLGPSRASLASYNTNKYGLQTSMDPWFPAAGNGIGTNTTTHTSWIITTNDPTDANLPADTNFQAGWVQHLTNTWHSATNGGLVYYLMDNEWSLWQSTHRDIHPVGPTMDEVFTNYCNYATMVKGIDPDALVAGPEEWGWPGYFYSGYDQQWSGAHGDYNPAHYPDRIAHGGQDFGPWFLAQVNLRSQAAGKRLLDVFTLHCYPQENGVGGDGVDSATATLRNESTRQFWDTNYVDPSWIGQVIALIPRMRSWVTTNYPGTKIGITEYDWGAQYDINGATAQADILGIFGREGLDLATRWTCPGTNSPVYNSFRIYRNYDGNKSTFGDTSVLTTVPNPDNLSAFAAIRTNDSAMTLMVINKDILNATPLRAVITNFANSGTAQAWQLTSANAIIRLADVPYANGVLSNTLPSQSITLFILPTAKNLRMRIGTNAPPSQMELWMDGHGGQRYILQSSTNLTTWSAVSTNTFSTNSFRFVVSTASPSRMFYRGVLNSP